MPDAAKRVRQVLGDHPLPDLSFLIPPLEETVRDATRLPCPLTDQTPVQRELILVADGSWDAIRVWQTAYSLGLRWGNLDLFHWQCPRRLKTWFCVHRLEEPAGFLPERALEGDRIRGLVFLQENEARADAAAAWDRLLLAAAAWVRELGGRPIDRSGQPIHPWSGRLP